MESERIERQYQDEQELYTYLMENGEVTFASYVDSTYKKNLLLSAASFFEHEISKAVIDYAKSTAKKDSRIAIFVERKAVSRQFHTYFQWEQKNTNSFWGLFGDETKNKVKDLINNTETLKQAEADFLELGKTRNLLVHENFSEYDVNITVKEIYEKYQSACCFIEFVFQVLSPTFLEGKSS